MDRLSIIRSEVSQMEKENIIWYHLYVKYKHMVQMNLFTKQKLSPRCRKQIQLPRGRGGIQLPRGGGINWEIRTDMHVLPMLSSFSCVWLRNPMDCSPPGSSIHGILQARILAWVAMPSSRQSSQPRDWTAFLSLLL